jgi:hypothetical protein
MMLNELRHGFRFRGRLNVALVIGHDSARADEGIQRRLSSARFEEHAELAIGKLAVAMAERWGRVEGLSALPRLLSYATIFAARQALKTGMYAVA